jgi:hypothetical protein
LLTVECGDGLVEVNVDAEGIAELISVLRRLAPGDHDHLFTGSWGGWQLTEEFPNTDLAPVHKLTIQFVEPPSRQT